MCKFLENEFWWIKNQLKLKGKIKWIIKIMDNQTSFLITSE